MTDEELIVEGALDFLVNASRANPLLRAKVQIVEDGIDRLRKQIPEGLPRRIDGVEVATIIAGLSSDRWRDEVTRLTDENRMLRSACDRYQTAFDSRAAEMEKQRDAHWRDLTACRSELASLALWLQDRNLLPTPGGDNYALVVGAAVEYMLSMELAVVALDEQVKELTFLRTEETDDLRVTIGKLWDAMTDDQCLRFAETDPVRYETVQDLWRAWVDRSES